MHGCYMTVDSLVIIVVIIAWAYVTNGLINLFKEIYIAKRWGKK